jgi:hypothetical protein
MKDKKTQAETIADLNVRCERPNRFGNFDRGVRASLSVSKEALLKEEARLKKQRAQRRAKTPKMKMELRDYDDSRGCPKCGHHKLLWAGIQPNGDWHGKCPNPDCGVMLRGNVTESGNITIVVTSLPD